MSIFFYKPKEAYYEFSNFSLFGFELDGIRWPTAEHYFQASKFTNLEYRAIISMANTPNKAFILGQQKKKGGYASLWTLNRSDGRLLNELIDQYKDVTLIREDWQVYRLEVMRKILKAKFSQNPNLHKLLLSTKGRDLIENSPRDSFWGVGKNKQGENFLGKLLMELRDLDDTIFIHMPRNE
jgi:predicted NAD-dependent protein-ADP-ribosyltransferase YbiA (DUF1768 family)